MTFTLECVVDSLAGVLARQYPDYPVYTSPNQQGTSVPCFFIFFMPSTLEGHVGNRYFRDLGIDIVFVQKRNIVNGTAQIHAIADYLDEVLELVPYSDGSGEPRFLRVHEKEWKTEDDELHYQFHIRERVAVRKEVNRMQRMEENRAYVRNEA